MINSDFGKPHKLTEYRNEIDEIDCEIIKSFEKRMNLSRKIGKFKEENNLLVKDSNRELEVFENIENASSYEFKKYNKELIEKIIDLSCRYQRLSPKKIMIINGPNLNLLGMREPEIYGNTSYVENMEKIKKYGESIGIATEIYQSNLEGEIINLIHSTVNFYDGIIINAGAYTHTSIAILDALKAVNLPVIEVHISDISQREDYRQHSYISEFAQKVIMGKGINGYIEALDYFI